jgi:DNA-binding beta-propeller fold protein YncE
VVAAGQESIQAPIFEVDPLWPKPLPNSWVQGMTIGLAVDFQDNVWIVHRNNMLAVNEIPADGDSPITQGECCFAAPPVLAFNQAGDLIQHWGGPGEGYEWPQSNHGLAFDHKDNIWIGGNGADDAHVLKFTKDGQFLMQLGHSGGNAGSNDRENFGRVAKIFVDAEANEAYIADGYGNRRVAVVDADSGEFKRYWGAYGNRPDDGPLPRYNPNDPPAQQFRSPVHCAELSNDRLLYVCDRAGDRIQVFHPDGTFVKEGFIEKETLGGGSAWDIAFSSDADQRYIYLADGVNSKVHIIDRESLEVLTSFGDGGRHPGQWYGVHSIATDSQGNIYTTETYEGKRLQKFIYKGVGAVKRYQGVLWPSSDD